MVVGKKWDTLFLVEDTWWLVKSKTTPLVIPVDSACRKASWELSVGWMCGAKCWLMMRYCACPRLAIWGVEMSWNGLIFRSGGMAMSKLSALLLVKFDMSYCIAALCINSCWLKIFQFFWHFVSPFVACIWRIYLNPRIQIVSSVYERKFWGSSPVRPRQRMINVPLIFLGSFLYQ